MSIQKNIHRVWLGDKEMPYIFKKWESELFNLHKTWNFFIWNETNIKSIKIFNPDIFNKLKNYSEKSDYIRFLCIYEYGGIYMDTDIEPLKDFSELLSNNFFIGEELTIKGEKNFNASFYGATKNNKILGKLIPEIEKRINSCDKNTSSACKIGPRFITNFLLSVKDENIKIYEPEFFNPIPWWFKGKYIKKFITKNTIAIHHFQSSWKPNWLKIFDIIKIQSTLILGKIKKSIF